jgi:hypothetical protein
LTANPSSPLPCSARAADAEAVVDPPAGGASRVGLLRGLPDLLT